MAPAAGAERIAPAPLGARVLAAFIDISLAAGPAMVATMAMPGAFMAGGARADRWEALLMTALFALALVVAAQLVLLAARGQSLGKLATRLRIVRADGGGAADAGAVVFVRTVLFGLLWLLPPLALVDGAFALLRPDGRCLHDLAAGTRVERG